MSLLLKGALIEYGDNFLGPLPNVVVFQFNPEQVTRTIEFPQRPTARQSRETRPASEVPIESVRADGEDSAPPTCSPRTSDRAATRITNLLRGASS